MAETAPPARVLHFQAAHAIRRTIAWNTPGASDGVFLGTLPAGAILLSCIANVSEAFNASGEAAVNAIVIGTAADDDAFVTNAEFTLGTIGKYVSDVAPGVVVEADTPVIMETTVTGPTPASAGVIDVVMTYVPAQ